MLAGAAPDFSQGLSFCESQPGLPMCRDIAAGKAPVQPYPKDVRVKALVIADPLNAFAPSALAGVAASVQLWASEQGGDGVTPASVEALRQGLPAGTDFRRVAGAGHFAFVAPCSQAQADALPSLCTDGGFRPGGFSSRFQRRRRRFHAPGPALKLGPKRVDWRLDPTGALTWPPPCADTPNCLT